ncbi:MAG: DUF4933 domain-containing protein [Prevotella sp.]|jgi:hypothetical protein|nr:DUF4933 domain-containing protein [Prevotella sp.]
MKKATIVLLVISFLFSCGGKKKQGLAEEALEEKKEIIAITDSEEIMDTVIPAKGVKYKGSRTIDNSNPPVKLNLAGTGKEDKSLDVANYYTKVRYTKLKHPLPAEQGGFLGEASISVYYEQGMSMSGGVNSSIFVTDEKIIAGDDYFGFHCYDKEGKFEYSIASRGVLPDYNQKKNELTINWNKSDRTIMNFSVLGDNCLYYAIENNKPRMFFQNLKSRKNYLERPGWYGETFLYKPNTIASYTYRMRETNPSPVFRVFDYKGDTLSVFMNYNLLPAPKKGSVTNPDSRFLYYYNDELTMRQAYNDTIYRMVSEKELRPIYIMDFGSQKLDVETGLSGDKSNKLIPYSWTETTDFVFIIYTKDYDCLNNRNSGSVIFNYAYYDKASGKLYNIPSHKFPEEYLINNSIEGGIPLIGNNIRANGKLLYIGYTKYQLESVIKQKDFASLSQAQQDKLKSLNENLQANEMLVMILE